ncbi:hypothetical protein [Nocardioides dongkuii]|uniref:hypothetical protein n=1 Tax=Nocardioides dongkuii TaxID=2760089 RepID=UPI001878ADBD|nr:hypothetical protein [Nocardioides dongkuii]
MGTATRTGTAVSLHAATAHEAPPEELGVGDVELLLAELRLRRRLRARPPGERGDERP